ncbi:hypothetical protein [Geothrix campi]|uniref:hypothetical protein n=1 Tax=Geothrix campi TaxID=2966450 RepID=UPI0021484C6F|nr:hypothetical protein [Geothrix sp. SG10]
MADEKEVAVKLSADVKSLLQGMKDAQEHTEKAVSGMKGDLGSAIESFDKFGAGAVAIGMVGLAFEALGEVKDKILEAVHATNELTEEFESLNKRTGASFDDLSVYKNALVLTGGTMGDLSGILNGLQRKMAASPEIYIANKIAADEAALSHQDLMTTLSKSVQVIASIEDPGRRSEVAIALLGSRAQAILPQIMKMNEMIEKDGPDALKKYGAHIDNEAIAKLDHFEIETGKVKLAIEQIDQKLADSGQGWAIWGNKVKLMWSQATLAASEYYHTAFPDLGGDEDRRIAALKAQWAKEGILPKPEGAAGEGGGGDGKGGKGGVTAKELEEQKKAAEERLALRKTVDEEIMRSAAHVAAEQIKDLKSFQEAGTLTWDEMTRVVEVAYDKQYAQTMKALKDEERAYAGKPAEMAKIHAKMEEEFQKYQANLSELERKTAENTRKERAQADADAEKARKQNIELARIAAKDELDIQRAILDEKEQALDDDLARGKITLAQWTAARQAAARSGLRAELDALDQEQAAAREDLVKWRAIQAQKDAINRKAAADITKISRTAAQQTAAFWDQAATKATTGWTQGIQQIIHGEMSLAQGVGGALKQIENQTEQSLINMGLYWVKHFLLRSALQEDAHMKEVVTNAKSAASGAYNAMVGIPYIGPFIAPVAAAVAFAGTMAFAEGGWDQVPADQVAMIHKNEMVLPAHIAGPLRESLQGGGGLAAAGAGSGPVNINIHSVDAKSVERLFAHNQGPLLRTLREAMRNGRRS